MCMLHDRWMTTHDCNTPERRYRITTGLSSTQFAASIVSFMLIAIPHQVTYRIRFTDLHACRLRLCTMPKTSCASRADRHLIKKLSTEHWNNSKWTHSTVLLFHVITFCKTSSDNLTADRGRSSQSQSTSFMSRLSREYLRYGDARKLDRLLGDFEQDSIPQINSVRHSLRQWLKTWKSIWSFWCCRGENVLINIHDGTWLQCTTTC